MAEVESAHQAMQSGNLLGKAVLVAGSGPV
jgi:hypothetical protein